jgi:hypothetical protein
VFVQDFWGDIELNGFENKVIIEEATRLDLCDQLFHIELGQSNIVFGNCLQKVVVITLLYPLVYCFKEFDLTDTRL